MLPARARAPWRLPGAWCYGGVAPSVCPLATRPGTTSSLSANSSYDPLRPYAVTALLMGRLKRREEFVNPSLR